MIATFVTALVPAATTPAQPSIPPGVTVGYLVVIFVINGLITMGMFRKAGLAPWSGFVPFYGSYQLVKMAGFNGWMFLLLVIPIVNIVFGIIVALRLARASGHGGAFGFFLMFLISIVGYLICSYGSDGYRNPVTGASSADGAPSVYAG